MNVCDETGTVEQQRALQDLVEGGFGGAIVAVCNSLQIDGGWLEKFVLDEMITRPSPNDEFSENN